MTKRNKLLKKMLERIKALEETVGNDSDGPAGQLSEACRRTGRKLMSEAKSGGLVTGVDLASGPDKTVAVKAVEVTCPECNGMGSPNLAAIAVLDCPRCKGKTTITKFVKMAPGTYDSSQEIGSASGPHKEQVFKPVDMTPFTVSIASSIKFKYRLQFDKPVTVTVHQCTDGNDNFTGLYYEVELHGTPLLLMGEATSRELLINHFNESVFCMWHIYCEPGSTVCMSIGGKKRRDALVNIMTKVP